MGFMVQSNDSSFDLLNYLSKDVSQKEKILYLCDLVRNGYNITETNMRDYLFLIGSDHILEVILGMTQVKIGKELIMDFVHYSKGFSIMQYMRHSAPNISFKSEELLDILESVDEHNEGDYAYFFDRIKFTSISVDTLIGIFDRLPPKHYHYAEPYLKMVPAPFGLQIWQTYINDPDYECYREIKKERLKENIKDYKGFKHKKYRYTCKIDDYNSVEELLSFCKKFERCYPNAIKGKRRTSLDGSTIQEYKLNGKYITVIDDKEEHYVYAESDWELSVMDIPKLYNSAVILKTGIGGDIVDVDENFKTVMIESCKQNDEDCYDIEECYWHEIAEKEIYPRLTVVKNSQGEDEYNRGVVESPNLIVALIPEAEVENLRGLFQAINDRFSLRIEEDGCELIPASVIDEVMTMANPESQPVFYEMLGKAKERNSFLAIDFCDKIRML